MNSEDIQRERERRRRRMKQKRRQARLRALVLVATILVVGVVAITKLKNIGTKSDSSALAYGDQAAWFILKNNDALDHNKAYSLKEIGNLQNNLIADKFEIRLMKGSNHITRAKDYAYDAAEISDIIEGKLEYTGKKKIAFLTFDDGPNHTISPQILDTLKEKEAHGTFFVVGKIVSDKTKDVLMRELSEGHAIALHSYTHDYKKLYPGRIANESAITEEAQKTQGALQKQLGENFHSGVWRYPGGHMSWQNLEAADKSLQDMGIAWIDWNSLTGDAEPKSRRPVTEQGLVDFMARSIQSNEDKSIVVVLMHDAENKQLSANALGMVIDHLRAEGYIFGILK